MGTTLGAQAARELVACLWDQEDTQYNESEMPLLLVHRDGVFLDE